MEKKTYVSIIDRIINVLDKDIDLFLEDFEVEDKKYYHYMGERAEYISILSTHFVPIHMLCKVFRWNNTYIHLADILDSFLIEFLDDYNTLKNNNYYELSRKSRSTLIKRRYKLREYLRFEFIEGLMKHLKEDADTANIYGDKQLKFRGFKKPERVYRSLFVSDIENLLKLKAVPESLYKQSLTVLTKYLVKSAPTNRMPIRDIVANMETYLNDHNCTDPAILKYLLVALLFVDENEFKLRDYEILPGESIKIIK